MKARSHSNHGKHAVVSNSAHVSKDSRLSEKLKLFPIAIKMKKSELSDEFIVSAVQVALEFEGVADLMNLWAAEDNGKE